MQLKKPYLCFVNNLIASMLSSDGLDNQYDAGRVIISSSERSLQFFSISVVYQKIVGLAVDIRRCVTLVHAPCREEVIAKGKVLTNSDDRKLEYKN